MKKIFFAIIALAAFVGCNTNVMEEVATTPAYLTTSFEVDLNGESRVFNENLEWSWTVDDKIAAYQVAGEQLVNTLSLKANGKFGAEEFAYETNDPADFKFVYPAAALNDDKTLGYVQTGKWTPTLVGIVENATVSNIGTVEMAHMSAAFEIRVWDEGSNKDSKTPKNIKEATITSKTVGGVSASLTNLSTNTNTVVFNVAGGEDKDKKVVVYDITLVDTNGRTYTVSDKELTFVNGQRTILNVEWKYPPTASYTVYSSYNSNDGSVSKNNGVDGRSIYVKNVAIQHYVSDAATLTLKRTYKGSALDDVALTVGQEWSANSLALGTYTFQLVLTDGDYTWSTPVSSIYVTGIPYTLNPAANDDWNAWTTGGNIAWNNSGSLRMGYNLSDWGANETAYVQKTLYVPSSTSVRVYAKGMVRATAGSTVNFIIRVSGADVATASSTGGWSAKETDFNISAKVGTMTSTNPTIYMQSYKSTATRHTRVDYFKLEYNN